MLRLSVPLMGSSNEPLRPRGGRPKGRRWWNGNEPAEGYLIKSQSNEITRLPKICFPVAPVNPAVTICSPHVLDSADGRRGGQSPPGDVRDPRRRAGGLSLGAPGVPRVPGAQGARSRGGDVRRHRGAGDAGPGGNGAGGAGPAAGGSRAPGLGRARRDQRPPAGRGARVARAPRLAPEGRAPPPSRPPDGDGGLVPAERLGTGGDRRSSGDQAVPKRTGAPQKRTNPSQKRTVLELPRFRGHWVKGTKLERAPSPAFLTQFYAPVAPVQTPRDSDSRARSADGVGYRTLRGTRTARLGPDGESHSVRSFSTRLLGC